MYTQLNVYCCFLVTVSEKREYHEKNREGVARDMATKGCEQVLHVF